MKHVKYLGVIADEDLLWNMDSWTPHILYKYMIGRGLANVPFMQTF